MKQEANLIRARVKTPRAAAIAGILFSVLLITGLYYSGFRSRRILLRLIFSPLAFVFSS
jgi:hypothetical protein